MPSDPFRVARDVADLVLAEPPTLGPGRLVCIDGPSGSGKTTLSAALSDAVPDSQVVHCDELIEGWPGLPGLAGSVAELLAPLVAGEVGHWRRWDWTAGRWAGTRPVRPGGLLVLEGVGSWSPAIADLVGVLVWVEVDTAERLARGLARDGNQMRAPMEQWRRDEDELFARLGTRRHADLVIDTAESTPPPCLG